MKKQIALLLLTGLAVFFFVYHQSVGSKRFNPNKKQSKVFTEIKPQNIKASAFAVSEKVSSFAPAQPEVGKSSKKMGKAEESVRTIENKIPFRKQIEGAVHDTDSALANFLSSATMPSPNLSFNGLSSNDNAAAFGFRLIPPDTNGDVGLNHYVQSVNLLTRVYDKSGNPLTPPFKLSSIFASLETRCAARDDGDAIVLYDALADRWLISQYCTQSPPFRQMIAVSKTSDPTGEFYVYEFVMPNNKLNDYPKFGVWHDAYYMSTDEFFGSNYAGTGVFAFDREKLIAGDPTASYIYFDLASPSTIRLGGLLPTDFDGLDNPPPADSPNIFVGYTATEYGESQDAIRLFEFKADFENPDNSTFSERNESPLVVAPFDPTSPAGRDDIGQPTPGEKLDSQSDRLMFRAAYRNLGTDGESIVVNQSVRITPVGQIYRAGVRVYEFRKTNGTFGIREQTTIGSAETSRWMGSVAQDKQGNIAVEYNIGSEGKQPSIVYSGKLASEPIGTFRTEANLIRGTGVQKAFGFRWGDYSAMSIDPKDDCTFWTTNEYYSLQSQNESDFGWLTRIGNFKFSECVAAQRTGIKIVVKNAVTQIPIPNAKVELIPDQNPNISPYTRLTQSYGETERIDIPSPRGYDARVSAKGFITNEISFSVAGGSNDPVIGFGVFLQPTAVLENTTTEIIAESCVVDNAVDPGETITLNIPLQNTGTENANNLTATLLETGGVANPSGTQNYGAIPVNGESVSRPFTFTASTDFDCGEVLTLTLQLQDGAENLGTVSINLRTGKPRMALSEDFDNFPLPNLPPDWTSSAEGGQETWKVTEDRFDSPPNAVFSPDVRQVGLNEIVTPAFSITSPNAVLTFRNWYELETTFLRNRLYDGSVLEIKIGENDWQDILDAGGSFESGGYDGTIDGCCQNPLAGRLGWSGRSGVNQESEFITTKAKLPATAAGNDVRLRWRVGTDIGTFREGQYLDDIVVSDGFVCSCVVNSSGNSPFDFDGDSKTDLSVFRPTDSSSEADFFFNSSINGANTGASWGAVGDLAVNADYDGDGKTDFAVYRPSTGTWFVLQSSDNSIIAVNFGLPDDKLTPADYDGDGKADIAVYRPTGGTWYILKSSDGQVLTAQFGISEDLPVNEDYDGDGKTDLAVWRPTEGTFYVLKSSDGNVNIVRFGLSGDKPVAGDFDGDGKADFVVYRPAEGIWYLLNSTDGFSAVQFGVENDLPLQADFDGDGKRDVALYRPTTSVWYYLKSSDSNAVIKQFGINNDTPIPSIYVR